MIYSIFIIFLFLTLIGIYFSKIKGKQGLLGGIYLYLLILVFFGGIFFPNLDIYYYELGVSFEGLNESIIILFIVFIFLFIVFYILLYFFAFLIDKKNLTDREKSYIIIRDFLILGSIYSLFFIYSNYSLKYKLYYNWYLNPDNFHNEIYICDNDIKLILEHNYKTQAIVNPYNSFFDFLETYGKPNKKNLSNKLNKNLINKTFLSKCLNEKGNNYWDEYIKAHGIELKYSKNSILNYGDYGRTNNVLF